MEKLERSNEMKTILEGVESIEEESFTAGGKGGSGKDTDNSAIRLRAKLATPELLARVKESHPGSVTNDGELLVEAQRERNQSLNRKEAYRRMEEWLTEARQTPKERIETKPTKASKERRLQQKEIRGALKQNRRKVNREEQ